jgi:hypothetical protein
LDSTRTKNVWRGSNKRAAGLKETTYDESLQEVGFPTLEERRHRLDMLKTYLLDSERKRKSTEGHDK